MKKIRVLVAEDNCVVKEAILSLLTRTNLEFFAEAANGQEAVEMACALRPDVVLMDIEMPVVDGLEATRRIQECCPLPVIMLTAHESQDFVNKASEAGAAGYLAKTAKPAEIERAITIAVARHNDLVELRRLNMELEKALAEVKTLRGLIPICMFCKNIRDDEGYWSQIEKYVGEHSEAKFTHGICPDCAKQHYPEEHQYISKQKQPSSPIIRWLHKLQ